MTWKNDAIVAVLSWGLIVYWYMFFGERGLLLVINVDIFQHWFDSVLVSVLDDIGGYHWHLCMEVL